MILIVKNKIFLFLLFSLIFFFEGCVSSNVGKINTQIQDESSSHIKENDFAEEKLRFIDWKYKGFGKTLPDWVEFAVDDDFSALKKNISDFSDKTEIKIIKGFGINYDHAEQSAKAEIKNENPNEAGFVLFDNFWVKFNEEHKSNLEFKMPYVSFYLFYKNS